MHSVQCITTATGGLGNTSTEQKSNGDWKRVYLGSAKLIPSSSPQASLGQQSFSSADHHEASPALRPSQAAAKRLKAATMGGEDEPTKSLRAHNMLVLFQRWGRRSDALFLLLRYNAEFTRLIRLSQLISPSWIASLTELTVKNISFSKLTLQLTCKLIDSNESTHIFDKPGIKSYLWILVICEDFRWWLMKNPSFWF